MTTSIYEIKKGRKWETVRATSMNAIDSYCEENGYSDWRKAGMRSRSEMVEDKELRIVA